jgi:hypothetical protein
VWRRFEVQLEIPKPDFEMRKAIAAHFMPPVKAPDIHLRLIAWFTEGSTGAEIESLVRTYKKATTVREEDRRGLLDTLRQFATLNAARVQSERRALLFEDSSNLFRAMRDDPILGFSMADIGEIAGKDKSTVSRQLGRAAKSGEGEVASPIQIVLNPENYEEAREAGGGGGRKDFFAHRDAAFVAHRNALVGQLDTISGVLSAQSQGDVGFVKVILRREAWAKSHRPVASLFRDNRTPVVGGGDLGVMIVEARPATLRQVAAEIARAETHTEMRFNEQKQKDEPYPSARKSETGAIDRIELYGPADRRSFSVEEAVAWLSNPMTGSSYQVELFDSPPISARNIAACSKLSGSCSARMISGGTISCRSKSKT